MKLPAARPNARIRFETAVCSAAAAQTIKVTNTNHQITKQLPWQPFRVATGAGFRFKLRTPSTFTKAISRCVDRSQSEPKQPFVSIP